MIRVLKKLSLYFLGLFFIFHCNKNESQISESAIDVKTFSFFQLKQNPISTGLKFSISRNLATIKQTKSDELMILAPVSEAVSYNQEIIHLVIIVTGESIEANKEFQKQIFNRPFIQAFKLMHQYHTTALRATADFNIFTHAAVILEKRSLSFLRQSSAAKAAIIMSEKNELIKSDPSVAISNNWVFSENSINVIKVIGLANSYNWAGIELNGSYYRNLQKVEESNILILKNIKESSIDQFLP